MMLPTLTLLTLVAAVLAAPSQEPNEAEKPGPVLQARAPLYCNNGENRCPSLCAGGSRYLDCSDSYVSPSGSYTTISLKLLSLIIQPSLLPL